MKRRFFFHLTLMLLCNSSLWAESMPHRQPITKFIRTTEVTTGAAITFPVVVALIALISSLFSIYLSFKLKDKEYKNDYYKKVIDKRIKAIEAAEAITSIFMLIQGFGKPMRDCYVYYVNELDGNKLSDVIDNAAQYNFWYSGETLVAVRNLTMVAFPVEAAARKLKANGALKRELQEFAATHHQEVSEAVLAVGESLAADMSSLYDVERFFKSKTQGLPR